MFSVPGSEDGWVVGGADFTLGKVGIKEGLRVGDLLGSGVGKLVGEAVGGAVGFAVGWRRGSFGGWVWRSCRRCGTCYRRKRWS